MAGVARPPCADVRGGVQRRKQQASAHCVIRAATVWQSTSGPDPMLFTPLGGAFDCSGFAAMDPAWRRPSWCGVVHLFVSFSTLGHTEGFSMIIRVWSADGCCDLFRLCCRFVWGGYLWASRGRLSPPRVDDPIQPSELSCCVPRVDVPIQSGESCFFSNFFFFLL